MPLPEMQFPVHFFSPNHALGLNHAIETRRDLRVKGLNDFGQGLARVDVTNRDPLSPGIGTVSPPLFYREETVRHMPSL